MINEQAFWKKVLAYPQDEVLRSAFAHWLQERTDPRSEFIRVQDALQHLDPDDDHWPEFQAREKAMLEAFGEGWSWEVFGDSSMDENYRSVQQPPPLPWKETGHSAVGGLTEVGFDDQSELLLVVSHNGRGVFDCTSGKRVARDPRNDVEGWYDEFELVALGIGPLEGKSINLTGLNGGALPTTTTDGWVLSKNTRGPWERVCLWSPRLVNNEGRTRRTCATLFEEYEIRAYGFTYTGTSFVLATSSDVYLFSRTE
jgi:uncharacterized protein (TIGR02996 family)